MDASRRFRIANRIGLLLRREFGEGIDCQRMVADPLYARDVLLVCDASPGSDLASLAQHFRAAAVEPADPGAGPGFDADASGFGATAVIPDTGPGAVPPAVPEPVRRWYSPARWLGR